jgi:hypothetical protein
MHQTTCQAHNAVNMPSSLGPAWCRRQQRAMRHDANSTDSTKQLGTTAIIIQDVPHIRSLDRVASAVAIALSEASFCRFVTRAC